ncbi:MAG: DUF3429 domain-containing protein [Chromatiaceae bacterium]|nr:DUF3429 domain-containing protein [Gammaproteobacteria bacterium]MCP5301478.1 DUF3429 domain-containing protein [Chromatiaceae bacterium]MCP5423042.1 DUF3429 domain-containing protein [Chromatiaceae bacterium]
MSDTWTGAGENWQRERRWLGYAGVIPFATCVGVMLATDDPAWRLVATDTLRHYAAVIASFLGAVHWGVAADDRDGLHHARLRWGVMPALLAWTLLALPPGFAFVGFGVLFTLILVVDRYLLPVLDDHYRQLRLPLTVLVVATMVLAAIADARVTG